MRESWHNCTESETQERRTLVLQEGWRDGGLGSYVWRGNCPLYLSLLASRSDSNRVRMSPSRTGPWNNVHKLKCHLYSSSVKTKVTDPCQGELTQQVEYTSYNSNYRKYRKIIWSSTIMWCNILDTQHCHSGYKKPSNQPDVKRVTHRDIIGSEQCLSDEKKV